MPPLQQPAVDHSFSALQDNSHPPTKSSRLARNHPDHPKLDALPPPKPSSLLQDAEHEQDEEDPALDSSASATPPTTTTPLSISEPSTSPEAGNARTTRNMSSSSAHDPSGAGPQPGHGETVNLSTGGGVGMGSVASSDGNAPTHHSQSPEQQDPSESLSSSSSSSGSTPLATAAQAQARRPGGLSENPNARSKSITVADGENTYGALNRHPVQINAGSGSGSASASGGGGSGSSASYAYRVGVSEDRNKKCRRTMEDAHSFVYDFGGVRGQGYFAVFDGHAGKQAAEWCGQNFHEYLLDAIVERPDEAVPDLLNETFHVVDNRLSRLASQDNTHSGCTAVTAFLRIEEDQAAVQQQHAEGESSLPAPKGFVNPGLKSRGLMHGKGEEELERLTSLRSAGGGSAHIPGQGGNAGSSAAAAASSGGGGAGVTRKSSGRRIKDFVGRLTGSREASDANLPAVAAGAASSGGEDSNGADTASTTTGDGEAAASAETQPTMPIADGTSGVDLIDAKSDKPLRRVLYTANVGDARAVLCRGGQAVRLTYDHKGSDAQEAKRITDAGGFVMNNRVNGEDLCLPSNVNDLGSLLIFPSCRARRSRGHALAGRFKHEGVCRGRSLHHGDDA